MEWGKKIHKVCGFPSDQVMAVQISPSGQASYLHFSPITASEVEWHDNVNERRNQQHYASYPFRSIGNRFSSADQKGVIP
jgi:hypothetical protein